MYTNNIIEIIGYQLEKCHSGILAWILSSTNTSIDISDKIRLWRYLFPTTAFSKNNIPDRINTRLEWADGRKIKIDLVIECIADNRKEILGIEFKVDSLPSKRQLDDTKVALKRNYGENAEVDVALALVGVSSSTVLSSEINPFRIIRIDNLLQYIDHLKKDRIVSVWHAALSAELTRHLSIETNVHSAISSIWQSRRELSEKGYRWPFPIFYLIYSSIRKNFSTPCNWSIYSGSNNPVMNCTASWKRHDGAHLYIEFCWEDLIVKCGLWDCKKPKEWVITCREQVFQYMSNRFPTVVKCQNRYGDSNSLCKFPFQFHKQEFRLIAEQAENIVNSFISMPVKE